MDQFCRNWTGRSNGHLRRGLVLLDQALPMCQSEKVKNFAKAIEAIHRHGTLLVYPLKNKAEPLSLWKCLHPRSEMRWTWDAMADSRVGDLWILREALSRSGDVVYSKWFQNRATFFSPEVFVDLLAANQSADFRQSLRGPSEKLLEALEMDSPRSTKDLKEAADLQGKWLEAEYNRSMKVLWQRMLVVGFGEIQDSSFPSLAVSATSIQFEELWQQALSVDPEEAEARLLKRWGEESPFWKFYRRVKK